MNSMNYYEKIREIRNKMFPERAELEFGCEVMCIKNIPEFNQYNLFKGNIGKLGVGECGKEFTDRACFANGLIVKILPFKNEFKILGQPVTITDVLRMIGKHNGELAREDGKEIYYEPYGSQHIIIKYSEMYALKHGIDEEICLIDISKGDDLRHQSEETLKKIYELIK